MKEKQSRGIISPWWYIPGGVSGVMDGQGITPSHVVDKESFGERTFVLTVSGSVYELGEYTEVPRSGSYLEDVQTRTHGGGSA